MTTISLPPLSSFQKPIFYDDRNWLVIAGRRSGKTGVALLRGVKVALRGGQVSWASANKDTAQAGWAEAVEFCRPYATRVAAAEDGIMEFYDPKTGKTGSIQRRSAYGMSSGRGYTFELIIIDEVQMTSQQFFKRILPTILTTGGKVCLLGTPPEADTPQVEACEWIKDMLDHPKRFPDWKIVHSETKARDIAHYLSVRDGGQKTKAEYEQMANESLRSLKRMMGDDYDREILAVWPKNKVGGRVYDNFNLDRHCTEDDDYLPDGGPVFWCIDRGEGNALSVVLLCQWQEVKNRLVVFHEVVTRDLISEETMVNHALQVDCALPEMAIYDPRAQGYMLALSGAGLPCCPGAGRDILRGIGVVKRWIGSDRIFVNPRCYTLLNNLEKYKRNNEGIPLDKDNDALDALRYLVRYLSEASGEPWSEEDESRALVMARGGGLDYNAVLEVHL